VCGAGIEGEAKSDIILKGHAQVRFLSIVERKAYDEKCLNQVQIFIFIRFFFFFFLQNYNSWDCPTAPKQYTGLLYM